MADLRERKRDSLGIELRTYSVRVTADSRAILIALALLVAAVLAGAAVPMLTGMASSRADASTIFIALGMLCLGFGSASVLYQHYRSKESAALRAHQESLQQRANALLQEFREYEDRSRAMNRDR